MTKDLMMLAAWAVFATCSMALAGSWHPLTYTVARADGLSTKAGVVTGSGDIARGPVPKLQITAVAR